MIVKVCFGNDGHTRVVECNDMHLEGKEGYTELICHGDFETPRVIHLGKEGHLGRGEQDHLYIMDKGQTVDHLRFEPQPVVEDK